MEKHLQEDYGRKITPFFNDLPFYSNIPRMDDIAIPLQQALSESSYYILLIVRIP